MEQASELLSCLYKNVTSFYLPYSDSAARTDYAYIAFVPIVLLYDALAMIWNTVMGFVVTMLFWIFMLLWDHLLQYIFDDAFTPYIFYMGCAIATIIVFFFVNAKKQTKITD